MMKLIAETGYGRLIKYEQELCGDKVELSVTDEETIGILADGLGSGVKANILATLTSSIIKTMLLGGATLDEVVETLIETLPICKERRVAYCTFTIVRIDKNGLASFVEYDNPDLIIIRNGEEVLLEKKELLLHGKKIKESQLQLLPGDFCMAMSDGVTAAGPNNLVLSSWKRENIVTYLKNSQIEQKSVFSLKKEVLTECDNRYLGKIGDDSTVFMCKMQRTRKIHVMIGPPLEKKDDGKIVTAFMDTYGTRVICGGKTAQIVSRVLEKQLTVLRNETFTQYPPMCFMKDIDLITEGIVTISRAVEIMEQIDVFTFKEYQQMQSSEEGAQRLVWILLNNGNTITFFLGNAQNPAHMQGKNIDFSHKIKKVERLAELLTKEGKHVEIFRG
ncbi:MAG: SpoIIE family protein phosphatase [Anaerovorax sp.]